MVCSEPHDEQGCRDIYFHQGEATFWYMLFACPSFELNS